LAKIKIKKEEKRKNRESRLNIGCHFACSINLVNQKAFSVVAHAHDD
jgi:hypothetical protein